MCDELEEEKSCLSDKRGKVNVGLVSSKGKGWRQRGMRLKTEGEDVGDGGRVCWKLKLKRGVKLKFSKV